MKSRGAENRSENSRKQDPGVSLTPEEIEAFLTYLREKGRVQDTLSWYRRGLQKLYEYLPEGKRIAHGTLLQWRETLREKGYAASTVNLFVSAANSYLEYKECREYQIVRQLHTQKGPQPELTRSEYLQLLRTAKALERERTYLLVKLFVSTGISLKELENVGVEAVEKGELLLSTGEHVRLVGCLRDELLSYASQEGIRSGPVFLDRDGKPIRRTNVTGSIKQLCLAAGIPEEKGTPRCLRKLYLATKANVEANISLLVRQAMDRILEMEQQSVGWENSADGRYQLRRKMRVRSPKAMRWGEAPRSHENI